MKKLLSIILVSLFDQATLAQKLSKEFDTLMSEEFQADGPGAVALVVKEDKVLYRKAFGKYELAPNFRISIFKKGGKMFARVTGQGKVEISPIEENKFSLVDVNAKLSFNLDKNGEVNGLILHQGGDKEAKKIE